MRLFYTTPEFIYKGNPCPGIPFLCNDDMQIVEVVTNYLLWLAMENAHTRSPATWKSHAETLYDYFSWLVTNGLGWDDLPVHGPNGEETSNVASYRNWSADLIDQKTGEPRIARSTLRKRLSQIMGFYRWALRRKRLTALPWEQAFKVVLVHEAHPSMYRHTRAARLAVRDNLRPRAHKGKALALLTLERCRLLLAACGTATLSLMTKLMLQSGLRNEECRTFPRKYVFDPSRVDPNRRLPIELSPQDMSLKGSKPRRIYVSWQLMKELFDYLNFGEGAERGKAHRSTHGVRARHTFLNPDGEPFSEKGLNNAYRKLWAPASGGAPHIGFRVTPHMLRHTFATLELYAESKRKNIAAALAWVRDRMGHASIKTTTIYVHCLDLIGEQDLNAYQREIDAIASGAVHAPA